MFRQFLFILAITGLSFAQFNTNNILWNGQATASDVGAQSANTQLTSFAATAPTIGYLYYNGTSFSYAAGSGGAAWGSITGTLSSQSDLNTALSGKLATSGVAADVTVTGTNIAAALAGKAATSHTHSWSAITSGTPTTLSGYGITDAAAIGQTMYIGTTATTVNYHAHKGRGLSLPSQGHCISQCRATRMGH